jgi:peptidoglycan/LPS O-acetylase OafA/YrhL
MENTIYEMKGRRHDLDWLRVLAFMLLILYHVAMFYVADWGWHIKSDTTSETLQFFMLLVNPWRMPLLFLISGAAMFFAAKKISAVGLLKLRLVRLLPPLILGMLVIVPPQMYFQILQAEGVELAYLDFYRFYLDTGTDQFPDQQTPVGLMTWNHLWFIPYLLVYTLAFVVLKPLLDRLASALGRVRVPLVLLYVLPVLFLLQLGLFVRPHFPQTFALVGDWYTHALYFSIFAAGYVMAGQLQIVRLLVRYRWLCLGIALATYVLFLMQYTGVIISGRGSHTDWVIGLVIQYLNGWSWLLAVMAWAAAWLNRPSPVLSYMNTAILPWYVLHQTITIVLAWYLAPLGLGSGFEAVLLTAGTVAGCALGYEIIRRFTLMRFLFGLKLEGRQGARRRAQTPV